MEALSCAWWRLEEDPCGGLMPGPGRRGTPPLLMRCSILLRSAAWLTEVMEDSASSSKSSCPTAPGASKDSVSPVVV